MKMKKLLLIVFFIPFVFSSVHSQTVRADNGIITVKDQTGSVLAQKYVPNLLLLAGGNGIIVLKLSNDTVQTRNMDLTIISSKVIPNVKNVGITSDYSCSANWADVSPVIMLYKESSEVEKRTKFLEAYVQNNQPWINSATSIK